MADKYRQGLGLSEDAEITVTDTKNIVKSRNTKFYQVFENLRFPYFYRGYCIVYPLFFLMNRVLSKCP